MKPLALYPIGILILILAKLWLVSGQPLWALAHARHDDLLFIQLANHLVQFHWLGPYDNLTLAKGPFYPMWIACIFLASLPLLLSQHLLYIAADFVIYLALHPLIENRLLRVVIFVLLLFNPVTVDIQLMRVIRDALYQGLTLLVVASAIGLFARRHEPVQSLLGWAVTCGLATAAFWLTREEGVWILPFLVPLAIWIIMAIAHAEPRNWQKVIIIFLPLLLPVLAVQVVSKINQIYYGVYATVEFKTPEFVAAYGALTRVRHTEHKLQIPVPRETRLQIYAKSKAFSELRLFFEQKGFWTLQSVGFGNHPSGADEIGGGWFMWALRDAAAAVGYFGSGAQAAAFFQRLADEVNAACDEKQLDCLAKRASLMPPWRSEYLLPVAEKIVLSFKMLAAFLYLSPHPKPNMGSPDNQQLFQDLTWEKLSDPRTTVIVRGWAVHQSKTLSIALVETDGNSLVALAQLDPSPDVYLHFLNNNQDIENARHARFEVRGVCSRSCILRILSANGMITDIPLKTGPSPWFTAPLWVYIDKASISEALPRQAKVNDLKLSLLEKITLIYQIVTPFLAVAALAAMGVWIFRSFRRRRITPLGFIALCIVIAICTRLSILAIIDVTSFPAVGVLYMSPLYPLSLLCYSLFVVDLLQNSLQFRDAR